MIQRWVGETAARLKAKSEQVQCTTVKLLAAAEPPLPVFHEDITLEGWRQRINKTFDERRLL